VSEHLRVTFLVLRLVSHLLIIVHPLVHRQSFQEHFVLFLNGVGHDLGGKEFLAVLAQGT